MWNLISTRVTQFAYFDQLLESPAWKGRKILDFGGNVGGFLSSAGSFVDHDDYWCVDLNQVVIEQGRLKFPRAHFVHYNRYSSEFNPNGVRNLPVPDLGLKFDIIVAFSVFTHVHQSELLELVGQLRSMLAPSGVLAFTFCDPSYDRSLADPTLPSGTDVRKNLEWRRVRNSARDIDEIVERARQSNWCVLIDEELYVEPGIELSNQERGEKLWESYCSFFTADYVASLFPEAIVLPPVSPEWQHCCIIKKTE
ncbi:MAG TPA: class I SAM-dependent methyltransferase [Pyrinomonadaceae bacterium]|jgi:SAM-dependent methyltransferase|nr:class I SAM-dependent methyltransferase [Pyrinomonadaceae bacterium]